MKRRHSAPAELYSLVEHSPGTILLEGARGADRGRGGDSAAAELTRVFTAPIRICTAYHAAELRGLFDEIEAAVAEGCFAAGYFAYECGAFFEPTAAPPTAAQFEPQSNAPIAWIGVYDRPFLFDHRSGAFVDGEPPALAGFCASLSPDAAAPLEATVAVNEADYAEAIAGIKERIRAGDIYQLNFSFPVGVKTAGSSAALYRRLRDRQPTPYRAFLHAAGQRILSFSPELFFRVDRNDSIRRITTRPMKGTCPRGRTTQEDQTLSTWLANDPKNRAENVMIVDLLRNDLGRIANYGTVCTEGLFAVERYPTLWQMTSTIRAELGAEVTFQQIFRALFPCGSVIGAPKVRAMQLISQLENRRRGVYTGTIGYFSKEETVFSVAIRTLELDGNSGSMGIGSGVVIDSDAAAEYRECLLKAKFLTAPVNGLPERFCLVETLLWQIDGVAGEFPFLQLHLDRLEDSAHYFDFPFDRMEIEAALRSHGEGLAAFQSHKVRLLLDSDGEVQIHSETLPDAGAEPLRIRIAGQLTDPSDAMYFHKTTHRPLYAEALVAATREGCDDVVFLNLRDEVTETAIHNIFVEKAGRLFTPPIACGLLAGVQRRHILATHAEVEESVLTLGDLREADAVFLSNAVRGLRRAIIDWDGTEAGG